MGTLGLSEAKKQFNEMMDSLSALSKPQFAIWIDYKIAAYKVAAQCTDDGDSDESYPDWISSALKQQFTLTFNKSKHKPPTAMEIDTDNNNLPRDRASANQKLPESDRAEGKSKSADDRYQDVLLAAQVLAGMPGTSQTSQASPSNTEHRNQYTTAQASNPLGGQPSLHTAPPQHTAPVQQTALNPDVTLPPFSALNTTVQSQVSTSQPHHVFTLPNPHQALLNNYLSTAAAYPPFLPPLGTHFPLRPPLDSVTLSLLQQPGVLPNLLSTTKTTNALNHMTSVQTTLPSTDSPTVSSALVNTTPITPPPTTQLPRQQPIAPKYIRSNSVPVHIIPQTVNIPTAQIVKTENIEASPRNSWAEPSEKYNVPANLTTTPEADESGSEAPLSPAEIPAPLDPEATDYADTDDDTKDSDDLKCSKCGAVLTMKTLATHMMQEHNIFIRKESSLDVGDIVTPTSKLPLDLTKKRRGQKKCLMLWQFIRKLLLDRKTNPAIVQWTDLETGTFRINNSGLIAQLWGQSKGRRCGSVMTFEKFSRAMRHYYRQQILSPVPHRKLIYRFGPRVLDQVVALEKQERQKRSADEANICSVENVFDMKPIPVDMLPKAEQESLSRAAEVDEASRLQVSSGKATPTNGEVLITKPLLGVPATSLLLNPGNFPSEQTIPLSFSSVFQSSAKEPQVVTPETDSMEDRLIIAEDTTDPQP